MKSSMISNEQPTIMKIQPIVEIVTQTSGEHKTKTNPINIRATGIISSLTPPLIHIYLESNYVSLYIVSIPQVC